MCSMDGGWAFLRGVVKTVVSGNHMPSRSHSFTFALIYICVMYEWFRACLEDIPHHDSKPSSQPLITLK